MSYETASVTVSAANTSRDATGTGVKLLYQADNACYVERVIWQPLGANAATAARVFVGDDTVNKLNREVTLPITSASSEVAGLTETTLTLDLYLKAGQRLLVTVGTAPTDGFDVSAIVAPRYKDFNNAV